VSIVSCYR